MNFSFREGHPSKTPFTKKKGERTLAGPVCIVIAKTLYMKF